VIQLLDYRILRCGPARLHRALALPRLHPGDGQDFSGFNEYVGDDACYPDVRVSCHRRPLTVRWVASGP
jgi:hypothetical protein